LRGTYIKPGMELKVYASSIAKGDETPPKEDDSDSYTVKTGDTLYSISRRFGLNVEQLKKLNPAITGNTARVGQILKVK
jgi:peptidoglycan-N-acetylglucosamine deacetylase